LAEFANVVPLKGGNTNDGLITKEATDNGSSQDRERCGKSRFTGITLPSSSLNPSREWWLLTTWLSIGKMNYLEGMSKTKRSDDSSAA